MLVDFANTLGTAAFRTRSGARANVTASLLLAAGLLASMASASDAAAEDVVGVVVVVLNSSNTVNQPTIHDLRLLFGLYKRSWQGGLRVQLVLPAEESASINFLASKVLRMRSPSEVERFYLQAVFQQRIPVSPVQLSSQAALAAVRANPGAIALVERAHIRNPAGLRILKIEKEVR